MRKWIRLVQISLLGGSIAAGLALTGCGRNAEDCGNGSYASNGNCNAAYGVTLTGGGCQAGSVYVNGSGCVSQGSCPAGYGSVAGTCVAGTNGYGGGSYSGNYGGYNGYNTGYN